MREGERGAIGIGATGGGADVCVIVVVEGVVLVVTEGTGAIKMGAAGVPRAEGERGAVEATGAVKAVGSVREPLLVDEATGSPDGDKRDIGLLCTKEGTDGVGSRVIEGVLLSLSALREAPKRFRRILDSNVGSKEMGRRYCLTYA